MLDFDLCLYDTQPAAIGGLFREFVYSARLDNLLMTYVLISSMIESTSSAAGRAAVDSGAPSDAMPLLLEEDPNCRIIAAFDHEEVGSASVPGAGSTLLEDALRRICGGDAALMAPALRKSVLVSADMAHAVHPNYSAMHEVCHYAWPNLAPLHLSLSTNSISNDQSLPFRPAERCRKTTDQRCTVV